MVMGRGGVEVARKQVMLEGMDPEVSGMLAPLPRRGITKAQPSCFIKARQTQLEMPPSPIPSV